MKEIIKKNMLIGEIISKYPQAVDIMLKHGMHCVGCHVATWETLEQAAQQHSIDISALVKDINENIK
jgi:hybrid cluster-associated redox disulfide protein